MSNKLAKKDVRNEGTVVEAAECNVHKMVYIGRVKTSRFTPFLAGVSPEDAKEMGFFEELSGELEIWRCMACGTLKSL